MPMVAESRFLPTPLRIVERGSQGLIESAPKMAAVAGLQAAGVPAPVSAGLVFGTTEHGFDPKQALIAAALPIIGEYTGSLAETIASKAGVSSATALQTLNKLGGAAGAAAMISADQLAEIMKLPPEKRKDALIEAAANVGSTFLLGMLGKGKDSEEVEKEKSPIDQDDDSENKTAEAKTESESPNAEKPKKATADAIRNPNDYKATFFATHPELRGKIVVHHAIEQQVLNRYPGVMTDAEIHNLDNLRGIPNDANAKVHLSDIRKEWNAFYREHPTSATKQQLLDKAREIDQKFGQHFNPPASGGNR